MVDQSTWSIVERATAAVKGYPRSKYIYMAQQNTLTSILLTLTDLLSCPFTIPVRNYIIIFLLFGFPSPFMRHETDLDLYIIQIKAEGIL